MNYDLFHKKLFVQFLGKGKKKQEKGVYTYVHTYTYVPLYPIDL